MCTIGELLTCSRQVETWLNQFVKLATTIRPSGRCSRELQQITRQICVTLLRWD